MRCARRLSFECLENRHLLSVSITPDSNFGPFDDQPDIMPVGVKSPIFADLPWQNPLQEQDTNRDLQVTSLDALVVINELNRQGGGFLPPLSGDVLPENFYDVNGDNYLAPIDALLVINFLNHNRPVNLDPEKFGDDVRGVFSAFAPDYEKLDYYEGPTYNLTLASSLVEVWGWYVGVISKIHLTSDTGLNYNQGNRAAGFDKFAVSSIALTGWGALNLRFKQFAVVATAANNQTDPGNFYAGNLEMVATAEASVWLLGYYYVNLTLAATDNNLVFDRTVVSASLSEASGADASVTVSAQNGWSEYEVKTDHYDGALWGPIWALEKQENQAVSTLNLDATGAGSFASTLGAHGLQLTGTGNGQAAADNYRAVTGTFINSMPVSGQLSRTANHDLSYLPLELEFFYPENFFHFDDQQIVRAHPATNFAAVDTIMAARDLILDELF